MSKLPLYMPWRHIGDLEVKAVLILTLRASWTWSSRPGRFTPRKKPITHWMGGWMSPRAGLDVMEKRKSCCLWVVQSLHLGLIPATLSGLPVTHENVLKDYPWRAWKMTFTRQNRQCPTEFQNSNVKGLVFWKKMAVKGFKTVQCCLQIEYSADCTDGHVIPTMHFGTHHIVRN